MHAQGFPSSNTLLLRFPGEEREAVTLEQTTSGTKLPESFANLPPVVLQNKDPPVPQDTVKMKEDFQALKPLSSR